MKYALNNGIIDVSSIAKEIAAMERKEILKKHPFEIWVGKDGKYRTHIKDDTRKEGRKLIARTTLESVEDAIVKDYKLNHEQRTKIFQVFEDWMKYSRETDDLGLNTICRYENDFEKFFRYTEFAERDIRDIIPDDIYDFLKATVIKRPDKITQKCYTNIKIVLNGIFTYAKSERKITCISSKDALSNFKIADRHFKHSVKRDSEQVYSDEELEILVSYIINCFNQRIFDGTRELGILFVALTGIRVGELCTLKMSDQEEKKLYIQRTESKGKDENGKTLIYIKDYPKTVESMAGIELSDSALEVWNMIKKENFKKGVESEYMFYEPELGRLKQHNFKTTLKRLCKESGVPFKSIHKLRKTYSSLLFAHNVDKKIVQAQMRHRSFETTERHYIFSMKNRNYNRERLKQADIFKINHKDKILVKEA